MFGKESAWQRQNQRDFSAGNAVMNLPNVGQCPACKAWNTMVEAPSAPASSGTAAGRYAAAASLTAAPGKRVGAQAKAVSLDEIELSDTDRTRTGFAELDRVLGSGVVRGSLVLVGGDPGIGKSTLLLQVCRNLAGQEQKVLYVSGEESLKQIKLAGKPDRDGARTTFVLE